jgi:hypothetical protein
LFETQLFLEIEDNIKLEEQHNFLTIILDCHANKTNRAVHVANFVGDGTSNHNYQ